MSVPIKPIIDKSKLLAIAKNVTKSKLITKNNNIPNQPIKVHIRTDSGLLYNDISLTKEKTKLINARLQNIIQKNESLSNINEINEINDNHLSIKSESNTDRTTTFSENININKINSKNLKVELDDKNRCKTERYSDYNNNENNYSKEYIDDSFYNKNKYINLEINDNENNENEYIYENQIENQNTNKYSHNPFIINYLKKKNFAIEKEFDVRKKLSHNHNTSNYILNTSLNNNNNKILKSSFSNSSFKNIYLKRMKPLNETELNKSSYRELRKVPGIFSSTPSLLKNDNSTKSIYFNTEENALSQNNYFIVFKIEELIVLEEKMSRILDSFKIIRNIRKFCIDWYIFYIYSSFKGNFENYFKDNQTQKIISHECCFLEFLSIIFIYESFGQATITQTAISKLKNLLFYVHQNFLIICDYIINIIYNKVKGNIWVNKLQNIIISKKVRKIQKNEHINILKEGNYNITLIIKSLLKMFPQNDKMNINTYSFYLSKIQTTQINTLIEYYKKKINQNLYQTINSNNKIYKNSIYKQNQYLNKKNILNIPYLSNKKDPKKYFTLVLDLDETLISYQKDEYGRGIIKTRPNLNLFLSEINKIYELIIFTAGTQEYADPILNIIDQKNCFFEKRLYRQHAIIIDDGFVKDLSLLGRDIKKVIIIDNNPLNYELQKENGIFIKSFYGEKDDNVLLELIPILKKIALKKDNDVRIELLRMKDEIFTKITTNLKK